MTAQITALPTPPSTNDPANFNTRADAFLGQMPTFVTEANALAGEVNALAMQTALDRAQVDVDRALAAASATSAVNAPGTNATSSTSMTIGTGVKSFMLDQTGKAFAVGQRVAIAMTASPSNMISGLITSFNANSGAMIVLADYLNPGASGSAAGWTIALAGPPGASAGGFSGQTSIASTYTIQATDFNKLVRCSGSFTLTLPLSTSVGASVSFLVKNDGAGNVLLARSGSDTLDGLSSYIVYPGEVRLFLSNGSGAWTSTILAPFYKEWTVSDAGFVWPPGYRGVEGHGIGAGGAGGTGANISTSCGGGGGGGCGFMFFLSASRYTAGSTTTITVGAGGAAVAPQDNVTGTGGAGGASSIGSLMTFPGGGGGAGGGGAGVRFDGSVVGVTNFSAMDSGPGGNGNGSGGAGGAGSRSLYGGGGGAGGGNPGNSGGFSMVAGSGGASNAGAAGTQGSAPGGGGGGGGAASGVGYVGGAGARGEIRMWGIV